MRLESEAPGVLATHAGALESSALGGKLGALVPNSTHRRRSRQAITCHITCAGAVVLNCGRAGYEHRLR